MRKKSISLMLALVLLLTLLAGCGGSSQTDSTVNNSQNTTEENNTSSSGNDSANADIDFDEEPYEVHYLYFVSQESPQQSKINEAVNELALKELNMKVNLIAMTFGTYFEQISVMLAAQEPLDIFPAFSSNFATYIESEYVVNLHDYLEYAPDIIEILGEDAYAGYIGDFLIGFSQMKERAYPIGLIVRKDIFDELGYSVDDFSVTTDDYSSYDQITELFAKVKEAYPSMTCLDGTSIMALETLTFVDNLGNNFGVLEDYGQTTTVTNWFESEQYKTFCEIGQKWYREVYTSADIAVNQDSGETKLKAGNTFSFITKIKPNTNIEKLAQTGYEVEVIPLSGAMKNTNAVNSAVFAIASASEDPKKAMQFMNWTYKSGEFNDLINWGIEGEDWIVNEDGMAAYPEGVDANSVSYHNDFGWIYPNQFASHPWVGNPPDIWDQYREYNNSLIKSKAFGFTFDSRPVATEEAQLNVVYDQYSKNLAFGIVDDLEKGIKEFNEALYAAGLQKMIDEKQRQLDEWLASQ